MKKVWLIVITIALVSVVGTYLITKAGLKDTSLDSIKDDYSYLTETFPDYYSGRYLDENQNMIICLKEGYPQEMYRYVIQRGYSIDVVKYSYLELNTVKNTISDIIQSEPSVANGVVVNVRDNIVEIIVLNGDIVDDRLLEFVEDGIATIRVQLYPSVNTW
jgi:hypothetical protein